MTRKEAKSWRASDAWNIGISINEHFAKVIDQIYDAHETKLKAKDERIANMYGTIKELNEKMSKAITQNGVASKFIVDRDSSVCLECLAKDERIAELEEMVKKMKCCTNCAITSFDYDYEDCKKCQNESLWKLKDNK